MSKQPHIELIARGVITHRSHVLLCQNRAKGYYYLPGGHIEPGEPAAEALRRELIEEAGLKIRVGPLLAIAEVAFGRGRKQTHELNLVFRAEHPAPGRSSTPPPVQSLEPEIAFVWIPRSRLKLEDVRPGVLAVWLRSVRAGGRGAIRHLQAVGD